MSKKDAQEKGDRKVASPFGRNKNAWALVLLLLVGIVLGGFVGSLADGISYLRWLNYGQTFGLTNPITLDLGILVVTFGLTLKISLSGILGAIAAIVIYRLL